MAVMRRLRALFGGAETRSTSTTLANPAAWLADLLGGRASSSGARVDPTSALEASGIYAGVRVISEDLASLPFPSYRRLSDDTKEFATDFHLWPILYDAPNEEMDSMQYVETMTAWAILNRCAYSEIVRDGAGRVTALWPIPPELVQPMRVQGELCYYVTLPSASGSFSAAAEIPAADGASFKVLHYERMFRLRGLSIDAVSGVSMPTVQREAIGLALALQEHAARFFGNGANPGGVLEHPEKLTDAAYLRLKAAWEQRHQGLQNSHRLAILEEGMKWHETTIANDKAQFLESRKLSLRDNARALRVKPHKIGDLEDATFSNIEHESIDHVVSTIRPWAVRWERAVRMQLMTPKERTQYVTEFMLDALLRGDIASRYAAYAIGRQWGWLSADDVRRRENMNPLPDGGGKVYMVPVNMTTPEKLAAPTPPPVAPPAPAGPVAEPGEPEAESPDEDAPEDPMVEDSPAKPKAKVRAQVATAFVRVFEQAFRAIVRREVVVLEKAAKAGSLPRSPGGLYAEHESQVREALRPGVEALAAVLGVPSELAAPYADAAANRHARLAVADLDAAIQSRPTNPGYAVRDLAASWLVSRAATLARREAEHAVETLSAGAAA